MFVSVYWVLLGAPAVSPGGMIYAKPNVRRGLLGRMLTELLTTRVMVKEGMKTLNLYTEQDAPGVISVECSSVGANLTHLQNYALQNYAQIQGNGGPGDFQAHTIAI